MASLLLLQALTLKEGVYAFSYFKQGHKAIILDFQTTCVLPQTATDSCNVEVPELVCKLPKVVCSGEKRGSNTKVCP